MPSSAYLWLLSIVLLGLSACEKSSPEPYINQLKSREADERTKAANRILRFGEEAVPLLLEQADSELVRVRFEVMKLFGRLKDQRAVPVLIEAMGDPSASVAQAAAFALGQLRNPQALPILLEHRRDPSKKVREEVIRALGACRDTTGAQQARNDTAHAALSKALGDQVPAVRIAAMQGLREFGYRGGLRQLIRLSWDPSPEVRHVAVQALGQIAIGDVPVAGDPVDGDGMRRILETLSAALGEPYQSIRTKAVRALEKIGDPSVVPRLRQLHEQGTVEDKREARRVLETLGHPLEEGA